MANNGVITIKFVEGGKTTPGPEPINDKMTQKPDSDKLQTAVLGALMHRAASQVKNTVISEAKYQIDMHFKLTDDYLGKQNLNIALGVARKVASTGLSIYTGITAGIAAGGVGGGILGGILAAEVAWVGVGFEIRHNYEQERININQIDAQLQFNRQRAGYSLTAGSIGENR